MSVSRISLDFSELNILRPKGVRFGEVVGIQLIVLLNGITTKKAYELSFSKRKSIHRPPSSNAYWNFMNLRAGLCKFVSTNGIDRQTREALYTALRDGVFAVHFNELSKCYHGGECVQYYALWLAIREELDPVTNKVRNVVTGDWLPLS